MIVTFPVPGSNVASVTPLAAFTFVRTALRDSPLSIVTMVPLTVKLPPTSVRPRGCPDSGKSGSIPPARSPAPVHFAAVASVVTEKVYFPALADVEALADQPVAVPPNDALLLSKASWEPRLAISVFKLARRPFISLIALVFEEFFDCSERIRF